MKLTRVLSWRWLVAVVALAAVAVGAVATYQPGLLPPGARRAIDELPLLERPVVIGLGVGLVLLGYAVVAKWMKVETGSPDWLADHRSEASERETGAADRDLMAAYDALIAGDVSTEDPFRARLRAVLVAAYAEELGSEAEAESYIDAGEWTMDGYAAAYLSDSPTVDYPWLHRLYGWLYPGQAYERRVARALRAVERACGDRVASYTLPEIDDPGPTTLLGRVRARLGREADPP